MGEVSIYFRRLLHDLKNSWYFRFWGILWLVCFAMSWVVIGILSKESSVSQQYPVMNTWIEHKSQLTFPRFQLRTQGLEIIVSIDCSRNNEKVQTGPCNSTGMPGDRSTFETCRAVYADNITVIRNGSLPLGNVMVYCLLTTTVTTNNSLVEWSLEGQNVGPFGPNAFSGMYLMANANAWVIIEQRTVHQTRSSPRETQWSRSVVYHTSQAQIGTYGITTIIGSFYVEHMEPADVYDGWRSFSDMGGFMFSLFILHTLAMLIFAVVFENNSQFLNRTDDTHKELAEKQPLVQ